MGPQTTVSVAPAERCENRCDANVCGPRCAPIAGQYVIKVEMNATPSRLELVLSRDGAQLVAQDVQPVYEASTPNGPDCGECHRAAMVEVAVP
jgi:hypothetical protein